MRRARPDENRVERGDAEQGSGAREWSKLENAFGHSPFRCELIKHSCSQVLKRFRVTSTTMDSEFKVTSRTLIPGSVPVLTKS